MPDLTDALRSLRPNAEWGWKSSDIEDIEWCSEGSPPTQDELEAELVKLKAAYEAQSYSRSRQLEYPPIVDQLDYIYHNGLDKWKTDVIDPIKTKYPKPS